MSYLLPTRRPESLSLCLHALLLPVVRPMLHTVPMTFANVGVLGTMPGQRDALVGRQVVFGGVLVLLAGIFIGSA